MSSHRAGSVWWRVHQDGDPEEPGRHEAALPELAHNEWDPVAQTARTKMLYSFGRADQLDRAAVERLIGALSRLLGKKSPAGGEQVAGVPGLEFTSSRPLGGTWLLDQLWRTLRIDTSMERLLAGTRRPDVTERVLFALVRTGHWPRRRNWPQPAG